MPIPLSGRRIFLASPSGLNAQRDLVQHEISTFNQVHGYPQGVAFIVVRWEFLPAGIGRPQARINPHIVESDFMIMLVDDHMGSATTPTPPYQTGIEEELATAAEALASPDSPMRDVLLLFRSPEDADLIAPSDDLKQVQSFRHDIEATKELTYQLFMADEELRDRLAIQFVEWARPLGRKETQSCPRLVAALDRSARPSMASPPSDQADELVAWADAQASEGLVTIAEGAFAKAAALGRPDHLLRYARFLHRTGQLVRAFELDERVLGLGGVVGSDLAEAVGHRVRALSSMGLVKRKLGDLQASRRYLIEAVAAGRQHSQELSQELGYALDQLGITEARLGDLGAADVAYREALQLRTAANDGPAEAQSLINLARLARQRGRSLEAVELLERAIALLADGAEARVLANALASIGQLLVDADPVKARDALNRALAINEQLQSPDGVSVTSNVLALLSLSTGDVAAAMTHAQRVLELSRTTGNREGLLVALRLLGQVECAVGEWSRAISALGEAVEIAVELGDRAREGAARLWLANAYRGSGDVDGALSEARAGLEAAEVGADEPTTEALRGLISELS